MSRLDIWLDEGKGIFLSVYILEGTIQIINTLATLL